MAVDPFSPLAPAHIRVLILPVGRIERSRFVTFAEQLKSGASIIPLRDLEPRAAEHDGLLFSPKAFPRGSLLYNYATSVPSEQQSKLSPFELFREALLVIGVKDASTNGHDGIVEEEELQTTVKRLQERYERAVHRQLVVLHENDSQIPSQQDDLICIRTTDQDYGAEVYQAAIQFSLRFLVGLGRFSRDMQGSPGIQTPGQTARSLQRTSSLKELGKRPPSRNGTPQQSSVPSSPIRPMDESRSKSPPLHQSKPSIDQITNMDGASNRPDSRASENDKSSVRASSQDRVSMQGFGSAASQEKLKSRGRARIGIAMASTQMLAGQWGEALRTFVEHTSKARVLSDQIWYAKGMEGIVTCLLLHTWAGLEDFQVPSLCYPIGDRSGSAHAQRFSVNIPSDFRLSSDGQPSSMNRLSAALPELLRYILGLYNSGEGSLELPFVVVAEATLRFCKLLAMLHNSGGALKRHSLEMMVEPGSTTATQNDAATFSASPNSIFKTVVLEMLSTLYPPGENNASIGERTIVLSGTASVYAALQMHRKEALVIKDLMVKLTEALIQARKKGAAEMGIHPAASLSVESGTQSILSVADESGGLSKLMSEIATTYGIALPAASSALVSNDSRYFGSDALKLEFMKALAAFCEAAPEVYGVLRVNAAMLRAFGPGGAVDAEPLTKPLCLSREEQIRCLTAINRTAGLSRVLGLPGLEAEYWDDFLVRDIEFLPAEPGQAVADLSAIKAGTKPSGDGPSNPLLYDPNASRPNTAGNPSQPSILVQNEHSVCRLTLQNLYEFPVEVESLKLVSDGIELKLHNQRFALKPLGIQRVSFPVSSSTAGSTKISGCAVKIQGCRERVFPIINKPWKQLAPATIKDSGRVNFSPSQPDGFPEKGEVAVTVIDPQPTLAIEDHPFQEATLMLLDGEVCELYLTVKNVSDIPAAIFDISTTSDALQLQEIVLEDDSSEISDSESPTIVKPDETVSFTFDVIGKPNVTKAQVMFSYCLNSGSTQYARIITVPVTMTVNAGLQVQRLDALPLDIAQNDECSFVLAFDVGNAWPKPLFYSCFCTDLKLKSAEPRRCHNHEGILAPGQVQRVFMPVARAMDLTEADSEPENVRKSLLERLRILWELEDEERKGWVDLSSVTMSDQVREVVIGEAVNLHLELLDNEDSNAGEARAGSFVTLRAKMYNRAARGKPLIVQLIPHALNSSDANQLERRISIAGTQHRFVPPITEGAEANVDFVLCPLLVGMIDLEVVVKAALAKGEVQSQWTSHKRLRLKVV